MPVLTASTVINKIKTGFYCIVKQERTETYTDLLRLFCMQGVTQWDPRIWSMAQNSHGFHDGLGANTGSACRGVSQIGSVRPCVLGRSLSLG